MVGGILISGFMLGAAGSLHCIGMCGPLSMVLPTDHLSQSGRLFSLFLYQLGRITTYSFLGLMAGIAGRGLYINGLQQWFSVIMGLIVLLAAVSYFLKKKLLKIDLLRPSYNTIQKLIANTMKKKSSYARFFLIGFANGMLPCGMVYVALAAALSMHHTAGSILFMVFFGMGTLPAMLFFGFGFQFLKPSVRKLFNRSVPVFMTLTGVILLLRGLNLGIPFISPVLPRTGEIISCFH